MSCNETSLMLEQPLSSSIMKTSSMAIADVSLPAQDLDKIIKDYYKKLAGALEREDTESLKKLLEDRPIPQLEINLSQYGREPLLFQAIRANNITLVNLLLAYSIKPSHFKHGRRWYWNLEEWPLYMALKKNHFSISYILMEYYPIHEFLFHYIQLSYKLTQTNCALLRLSDSHQLEELKRDNDLTSNRYICVLFKDELFFFDKDKQLSYPTSTLSPYYSLLKTEIKRLPFDQEHRASFHNARYIEKLINYRILPTDASYLDNLIIQLEKVDGYQNIDSEEQKIYKALKLLKKLYPSSSDYDESFYLILSFSFLPQINSSNASSLLKPYIKMIEHCTPSNFMRSIMHLLDKIGQDFLLIPWSPYPNLAACLFDQFKKSGHVELVKLLLAYVDDSTINSLNLPRHFLDEWHKNPAHHVLDALLIHTIPEIKNSELTSKPAFFRQIKALHNQIELLSMENNQEPTSSSSQQAASDLYEQLTSDDDVEITYDWRGHRQ